MLLFTFLKACWPFFQRFHHISKGDLWLPIGGICYIHSNQSTVCLHLLRHPVPYRDSKNISKTGTNFNFFCHLKISGKYFPKQSILSFHSFSLSDVICLFQRIQWNVNVFYLTYLSTARKDRHSSSQIFQCISYLWLQGGVLESC